jgi:hypothetical protein
MNANTQLKSVAHSDLEQREIRTEPHAEILSTFLNNGLVDNEVHPVASNGCTTIPYWSKLLTHHLEQGEIRTEPHAEILSTLFLIQ